MWQSAEKRGYRAESSQRTSAVCTSWWWWCYVGCRTFCSRHPPYNIFPPVLKTFLVLSSPFWAEFSNHCYRVWMYMKKRPKRTYLVHASDRQQSAGRNVLVSHDDVTPAGLYFCFFFSSFRSVRYQTKMSTSTRRRRHCVKYHSRDVLVTMREKSVNAGGGGVDCHVSVKRICRLDNNFSTQWRR